MISYSKNLLKNFKLLRDNDIQRRQVMVVLDIDNATYTRLYSIAHKRAVTEAKYTSSKNWIKLFNEGNSIFRIMSKYPEITAFSVLELYFRNQLVALELNETLDKSNERFAKWLRIEFVDKQRKLKDIAEEFGYTLRTLRSACEKFGIKRFHIENRKSSVKEVPYVIVDKRPYNFLKNPESVELLNKALAILTDTNSAKELHDKLNVSPRFAKRLHSDYNIFKADKIPYSKIIKLLRENRLTLREINEQLKLPKRVQFYLNNNIFAALVLNKCPEDIMLEENRRCVYPSMCGDYTYIIRAKGRANVRSMISILTTADPEHFLNDLKKIKIIIECKDRKTMLAKLNCTEDELKSLMTKYYIDEYMEGGNN